MALQLPRFVRGQKWGETVVDQLNNLSTEIERLRNITVSGGLELAQNASGTHFSFLNPQSTSTILTGEIRHVVLVEAPPTAAEAKFLVVREVGFRAEPIPPSQRDTTTRPESPPQRPPARGEQPTPVYVWISDPFNVIPVFGSVLSDFAPFLWAPEVAGASPVFGQTTFLNAQTLVASAEQPLLWLPTSADDYFGVIRNLDGFDLDGEDVPVQEYRDSSRSLVGNTQTIRVWPGQILRDYTSFVYKGSSSSLSPTMHIMPVKKMGDKFHIQQYRKVRAIVLHGTTRAGGCHLSDAVR